MLFICYLIGYIDMQTPWLGYLIISITSSLFIHYAHADDNSHNPTPLVASTQQKGHTDIHINTDIHIEKGIMLAGNKRNQQFRLKNPATQQDYLIQVFQPNVPAPEHGYPVLYMLDGNAAFPYASVMAQSIEFSYQRQKKTPPIIVAIGYPIDSTINVKARTFDYTLPYTGEFKAHPNRPATQYPQGGAEFFYQFIQQQLKPVIAQNYQINPKRQSLFGHSYGGLFTLYTFIYHREAFQHYIAASPSIWWNDFSILKAAQDQTINPNQPASTNTNTQTTLLMTIGELESKSKTHTKQATAAPLDIERMAQQLKSVKKLKVETQFISDATHFEAMFPAINSALKIATQE